MLPALIAKDKNDVLFGQPGTVTTSLHLRAGLGDGAGLGGDGVGDGVGDGDGGGDGGVPPPPQPCNTTQQTAVKIRASGP